MILSMEDIENLCTETSFERGVDYFQMGNVTDLEQFGNKITATVEGTRDYTLNIIVSLLILVIGLFLMLWSILHFVKVKGTPVPFNPPPKLVNTGPYFYVRNPMLSGVFILLNFLELKAIEEPELEKRLGKKYLKYKKRVPMFIPKLGKTKKGLLK
jgi:protein-S-isoprenylcysteine O-methyltransferase Ste14